MEKAKKYKRKSSDPIIAVRLNLDIKGFTYKKWGGRQKCKQGDWIVCNNGETYTIDAKSFAKTYKKISPGLYVKTASVWARQASEAGSIPTKEGRTHFKKGYWIVSNDKEFSDQYAITNSKFLKLYEPARKVSKKK